MYPIDFSDANLNVMKTYEHLFPEYNVGYSITQLVQRLQVAISMGAKMIEAHFTDRSIKSEFRDHLVSKTADEFKELIKLRSKSLKCKVLMKKICWK